MLLLLAGYEAVQVYRAQARTPAALAGVADRPLALADLSTERRATILAVEDPGFVRHRGVDLWTPGTGWTTITEEIAGQLFFPQGVRPGFDKLEQALIARFVLDPLLSKDEQLEIFLNRARFGREQGREVIGFEDAARTWFGGGAGEIGDRQFMALVAMLIGPGELNPRTHPAENAARVNRISALLAGRCSATGLFDVRYPECDAPASIP